MGGAIGGMLGSAIGIAISPLPIIVAILLLTTPAGRTNGLAFALGWLVSLTAVGTLLVAIGGVNTGKAVALVLFVVIGSLRVLLPIGVFLLGGDESAATLGGRKNWLSADNGAIMATVLVVPAAKFIGEALGGL